MKRIRGLCGIFALLIVVSVAGCGLIGEQSYTCDVENVNAVKIIRLEEYVEEKYDFKYTVLCEVVDCVTFVERLTSIKQSVNWGDPYTLNTGYIVICIEYENGDYDWVYSNTQTKIRDGKSTGGGYICFEKEQFNALLNDYLPENEQID